MMQSSRILEAIWRGDVRPATGGSARRMRRILNALLPVHSVALVAQRGVGHGCVLPDETELMPALPLGDVLAEELEIDVPYGAMVVISDAAMAEDKVDDDQVSYACGISIGEALIDVMRRGVFSLERETDALYIMALSYHRMAEGSGFQHLGLVPAQFHAGMAAALGAYWSGARSSLTDDSGLFLRSDFLECAKLRSYLKTLDGCFSAPAPQRITASLMLFAGAPLRHDEWLELVAEAVTEAMYAHDLRSVSGGMHTA